MEKRRFWTRKKIICLCIVAVLILLVAAALDSRLMVRQYTIEADKITAPVRMVLITDLHSCKYGDNMQELILAVEEQKPDLVLLGGDIFDDQQPPENTEVFLQAVAAKYPCYYVAGNHEYCAGQEAFASMTSYMESCGIRILKGDVERVVINGQVLYICGADDPDNFRRMPMETQLDSMKHSTADDGYTVLLSHRPEYYEMYIQYGYDLALCGHAHGGQWRIPFLINGVYTPNQGFFPDWAGGLYKKENTTMIVSRGLARESTGIPRIFNRPELVVVNLQ